MLDISTHGDTNVDLLSDALSVRKFTDALTSLNLTPLHNKCTRPASGTCLDHFWISNDDVLMPYRVNIIKSLFLSDHYPIDIIVPYPSPVTDNPQKNMISQDIIYGLDVIVWQ